MRRVSEYFDCLPQSLTPDDLKDYFAALVESHSWSKPGPENNCF
jgi:integrase/recombinase XerD